MLTKITSPVGVELDDELDDELVSNGNSANVMGCSLNDNGFNRSNSCWARVMDLVMIGESICGDIDRLEAAIEYGGGDGDLGGGGDGRTRDGSNNSGGALAGTLAGIAGGMMGDAVAGAGLTRS